MRIDDLLFFISHTRDSYENPSSFLETILNSLDVYIKAVRSASPRQIIISPFEFLDYLSASSRDGTMKAFYQAIISQDNDVAKFCDRFWEDSRNDRALIETAAKEDVGPELLYVGSETLLRQSTPNGLELSPLKKENHVEISDDSIPFRTLFTGSNNVQLEVIPGANHEVTLAISAQKKHLWSMKTNLSELPYHFAFLSNQLYFSSVTEHGRAINLLTVTHSDDEKYEVQLKKILREEKEESICGWAVDAKRLACLFWVNNSANPYEIRIYQLELDTNRPLKLIHVLKCLPDSTIHYMAFLNDNNFIYFYTYKHLSQPSHLYARIFHNYNSTASIERTVERDYTVVENINRNSDIRCAVTPEKAINIICRKIKEESDRTVLYHEVLLWEPADYLPRKTRLDGRDSLPETTQQILRVTPQGFLVKQETEKLYKFASMESLMHTRAKKIYCFFSSDEFSDTEYQKNQDESEQEYAEKIFNLSFTDFRFQLISVHLTIEALQASAASDPKLGETGFLFEGLVIPEILFKGDNGTFQVPKEMIFVVKSAPFDRIKGQLISPEHLTEIKEDKNPDVTLPSIYKKPPLTDFFSSSASNVHISEPEENTEENAEDTDDTALSYVASLFEPFHPT